MRPCIDLCDLLTVKGDPDLAGGGMHQIAVIIPHAMSQAVSVRIKGNDRHHDHIEGRCRQQLQRCRFFDAITVFDQWGIFRQLAHAHRSFCGTYWYGDPLGFPEQRQQRAKVYLVFIRQIQCDRIRFPQMFHQPAGDLGAVAHPLILDDRSRSDTIPVNRSRNQSSQIEHEATVSNVSEEQLFYLMSRGLTRQQATEMIVMGFLEPFTRELPMEYAVELNQLLKLDMSDSIG